MVVDDAHSDGTGDLFLIERGRQFCLFGGVGNKAHFKKDSRHVEVSQNGESAAADSPVISSGPLEHGSLDLVCQKKVVPVESVALERGVEDPLLVGG